MPADAPAPTAYARALAALDLGKRTPGAVYVHRALASALPAPLAGAVARAARAAGLAPADWQVAKFAPGRVSLLAYPDFDRLPFPGLARAWTVDLGARPPRVALRQYAPGPSQPILHRKELMRRPGDPAMAEARALTAALDARDLLADPAGIGTAGAWARRLAAGGVRWAPGGPLAAADVARTRLRANPAPPLALFLRGRRPAR